MIDTTEKSLLDSASIQQCEKLSGNADIKGKRAKALLELNNGESNSIAAEKSGLTAGQVSYLLGRFKKIGMELFTAQTVKKAASKKATVKKAAAKKATPAVTKPEVEDATPATKEPLSADKTEDKKKKNKKKDKKLAKKDKAKKDKKTKKDKKSKKKDKKKKSK